MILLITVLQEDVSYPGNVLMYLVNVAKQDADFADKIKNHYIQFRVAIVDNFIETQNM